MLFWDVVIGLSGSVSGFGQEAGLWVLEVSQGAGDVGASMGEMGVSFGVLLLGRWERRLGMKGMSRLEVLGPQISVQRLWVFVVWVPVICQ